MAIVNQVQKHVKMSTWDTIKFQFVTHCYINKIIVSDSDLNCLTFLSLMGSSELTHFCVDAAEEESFFKTPQTVRNCIAKCEKLNLVTKDVTNKKVILINPSLKIQTEGLILLDFKILSSEIH